MSLIFTTRLVVLSAKCLGACIYNISARTWSLKADKLNNQVDTTARLGFSYYFSQQDVVTSFIVLTARVVKMSANVSGSSSSVDAPSVSTPGRRSKVWEHFEKDLVLVGDVSKAISKYSEINLTYTRSLEPATS
jgi:hypothetical protein